MADALILDARIAHDAWTSALAPDPEAFIHAVLTAAAQDVGKAGAVALLLTDDAEMRVLNRTWQGKDAPTNVLSFPAAEGFGALGDVALAYETIVREADSQGKSFAHHTAHLLVHGYLHLLGYDHQTESDADRMEARERAILAMLGIADPYGGDTEEEAAHPR